MSVRTAAGSRGAWGRAIALYLVTFAAATAPVWLLRVSPKWDARDMLYPAFAALSDGLRSGRFPLWDPYTNCGYPLYADAAVSSGTNPVALLAALLAPRPSIGFAIHWLAHWAWAGLGAMFLARRLGAAPLGGVVAACTYGLSGFFVGHGEHTPFLVTAAWLPWSFGLADLAVERRHLAPALLAGVALGASTLAGYPGLCTFGAVALAGWLVLRWATPLGEWSADRAERRARAAWIAVTLVVCAILMVAIWSPSLVAFFRAGHGYTDRTGPLPPLVANFDNPFPPLAISSLLFPELTVLAPARFASDVSMTNGYAGLLALPLAAVWAARAPRARWWIVAFAAFMFVLSLGGAFGLRRLVYVLVPVTRYMRHSASFRMFWLLPLAAAAGAGATLAARDPAARRLLYRLLLGWTAIVATSAAALWLLPSRPLLPARALAGVVVPVWLAAAVAASAVRRAPAAWLAAGLAIACGVDGVAHVHGNSFTVWDREPWVRVVEARPREPVAFAPRRPEPLVRGWPWSFNAQQVLRVPVVGGYVTMSSHGFNEVLLKSRFREVLLTRRFWAVPGRTPSPPSSAAALEALASAGATDPVPAFVASEAGPVGKPVVPGTYGSVAVAGWAPERVELRVQVPAGGLLVSTERYAAGWTARVDGRAAPVERVNLYFVGVALAPGEHLVELRYDAGPFWALAALSVLAALGAIAGGIALELRRRASRALAVTPRCDASPGPPATA